MDDADSTGIDVALALAELDIDFDAVEGVLLTAASRRATISPSQLADSSGLSTQTADDVLLQLRRVDCATQIPGDASQYRIDAARLREVCQQARQARRLIGRYEQRQPEQTSVTPLITVPDDAAFVDLTPTDVGMDWLLPVLVRMIKRTTNRIVILTPFLEGTGLNRLREPLLEALADGIEVVIVTRYLHDSSSFNNSIMTDFWSAARDAGVDMGLLEVYDYTVWAEDVPAAERTQDGAKPSLTLHSKLLLSDDSEAYVGSANVTDYGFSKFLELGAHIAGPAARAYAAVCTRLIESEHATPWMPD